MESWATEICLDVSELGLLFGHQSCLVGSEGCRGQAGCIPLPHGTPTLELLIPVVPRSITVS